MNITINKSDSLGMLVSTLCLMHCLATPFLIALTVQFSKVATFWGYLDVFFLFISAIAIYRSSKTISKQWVKTQLIVSWGVLLFILLNEKIHWLEIPETAIYIPTISLLFLHFYSSKYCQCDSKKCCTSKL